MLVSTNRTGVALSITETMCKSTTDSAPKDETSAIRPRSESDSARSITAVAEWCL